ncbi:MAG: hypothetical protein LIO81_01715 [Clostridiales bacterium]|nr:hypothetical protein [Clostridiales bacterium]
MSFLSLVLKDLANEYVVPQNRLVSMWQMIVKALNQKKLTCGKRDGEKEN